MWCATGESLSTTPFTITTDFACTSTSYDYTWISEYSPQKVAKLPKNWRWFNVFRKSVVEALPQLVAWPVQLLRRARALVDAAQARRHKRKRFVQAVRYVAV